MARTVQLLRHDAYCPIKLSYEDWNQGSWEPIRFENFVIVMMIIIITIIIAKAIYLTNRPQFSMVYTLRGACLHDTGATFALTQVHSGSLSWLYICLHNTTMPAQVTPASVHPGRCSTARISLRYKISQQYHLNAKQPLAAVWNRSAGGLEQVAHA